MPTNENETEQMPESEQLETDAEEQSSQQQSAESDTAPAGEPQPEAWRAALNEALGAFAQATNERMERIERMMSLARANQVQPRQEQSKPQPDEFSQLIENPLFWQQQGADPRFLKYLQEKFRAHEEKYSRLESELKNFTTSLREKEIGEKIASEFEARTEQAIKSIGVNLPPRARTALEKVIGYEALCLQDPRRVDIQRITKEFVESWQEAVSAEQERKQAVAAAAAAKPGIPGGGAPAKPGAAKKNYKSIDDAIGDFRGLARDVASRMAEED